MSDIAIRVENLGKSYRITRTQGRSSYRTLQEEIISLVRRPFRRKSSESTLETVWALKDVSLEIKHGEAVGIIGRNGAGKSTLLKILSRITEPTTGYADMYGRVGSLLEVGTGFHPELTGRENIYLNGTILGMKKWEIDRKFDEIVAFAEVERYLDTPVKHYSSGMYVRLAFAVAAHLEPEILIVDEVLAVGDAAFQKKCLGKMGDVAKDGRTVLFVSHNVPAIMSLCDRGVLLEAGEVILNGDAQEVTQAYLKENITLKSERYFKSSDHRTISELTFSEVRVLDHNDQPSVYVELSKGLCLEMRYSVTRPVRSAQVSFSLWNQEGICVLTSTDLDHGEVPYNRELREGEYVARCPIPGYYLRGGLYWVDLGSSVPNYRILDEVRQGITFEVVDDGSAMTKLAQGRPGVISPVLNWEVERVT